MKASGKLLGIAQAIVLSAGLMVPVAAVVDLVSISSVHAAVISNIKVEGNKRVDDATIRDYVGIKPGKAFDNGDIDDAVKKLFATGLFSDVRINQVGGTLVVEVDEYSVVNQVIFQGNKKVKDDVLAGAVGLKPRGSFSKAQLESDTETVKAAYRQIGRDDTTVTTQVIDLGENRVNVVFNINEGGRTKIATVNFIGNKAFSDRRLSDVISTKRSTVLSFLLRNDVYDEAKLQQDEEALRRFYYNHGYADFRIVSSSAELNDAQNEYTINITVDEGERYRFGDVSVESTIEGVSPATLDSLVESRKGDTYSAKDVEDSIVALTDHLAGLGYAFAQVTPRGDRNFENRTIAVVYSVDQGPHTYIQRIEIRGNTRTRDYVIRREFDISEGDAFNQVLIQKAKKRLEELEYFTSVNISTQPGTQPDQVVLIVDVVEKSTGEFTIGAGYSTGQSASSGEGVSVQGTVSERNFLGRGQYIKVSAGGGLDGSRDYALSFTEPYFLGRRISAGFDIYRSTREYDNYDSQVTGGTVRFGFPITEALATQLAYNIASEKYTYSDDCGLWTDSNGNGIRESDEISNSEPDPDCDVSKAIQNGVDSSPWLKSSVSASIIYNTIDDLRNPHSGLYANFTTEYAGIGGDANFVKFTGRASYYKTLSDEMDLVALLSAGGGYIHGFGGGLRVFDLFENDSRMIRGFDYNGIGPRDSITDEHLGGTTYFNASAELQFPLPIIPPSIGLKGAVFADAATLYGNDLSNPCTDGSGGNCTVGTGMEWRVSAGASILWNSPFGPLRIDYAVPLVKEDGDDVQNFNFGVSTRF